MLILIPVREQPRRTTIILLKNLCTSIIRLLFLISIVISAEAQVKLLKDKTAPGFTQKLESSKIDSFTTVTLQLQSISNFYNCIGTDEPFTVLRKYEPIQLLVIRAKISFIKKIIACPSVLFADDVKEPKEELLFGFTDYAVNGISLLQSNYPQYNGNGLNVSVKENNFDTSDIDLKGRVLSSAVASTVTSGHASAMATIIAGGGNSWNYTKGAAWNSKLSSASFSNLLPEAPAYYQQPFIHTQNHSYGTLVEHFYGAEAAAYDASVILQPQLLHVFSVGNSGTLTPSTGRYAGINGYATITGNFKQAKNILTIGHIDSFYNVLLPSSKGPAFDGRIKPELVAFGEDGSSGAAALVSGIALTLQHAHQQLYGAVPASSLIKSVLINSADDVGATGIDFASGYGNANGNKAMQTILKGRFFNGTIASNGTQNFNITIPAGVQQLKLTLTWTDVAATPNTSKALINDLDAELLQNSNAQVWLPWVLSSFPHLDSLQKIPARKKDTVNTAEQISISDPDAGTYTITVKAKTLSTASQNFSIAWQIDSVETFQWYYPSKNDHLLPPDTNILRWQTTYTGLGELQISTDEGNSWQMIDANVNVSKGWYKYVPPAIYKKALLRFKTGAALHVSDTFSISNRPAISVGFNCADSVMLNWKVLPGITQYRLLRLGNQYLEPLLLTADTFAVLSKATNSSLHYAVEPLYQSKALTRSYTFNYNLQGAGCYIRTLLADLTITNTGFLQLNLSSAARVKTVLFEKRKERGFEVIHTIAANSNNLFYNYTDAQLNTGSNVYRAAVELTDGRKFYSDETTLYYYGNEKAILFPNPVVRTQPLHVLAKPEDELTIQFFNSNGSFVLQQLINDVPEQININHLSKGIYYYRVLSKSMQKIKSGTVVIY